MFEQEISKTPIFYILGRGSGAYLLWSLLDSHPNVQIPEQDWFVNRLYDKYYNTDFKQKDILEFCEETIRIGYQGKTFVEMQNINVFSLKETLLNYRYDISFHTLIKLIYMEAKSKYPKEEIRIIGNKSASYHYTLRKLIKVFPEAKFVFVIRNHIHNALSLKMKLNHKFPSRIVYGWKQQYKEILGLKKKYPDKFYLVKHEELVLEPSKYLKDICDFLKISYLEQMIDANVELLNKFYNLLNKTNNTKPISIEQVGIIENDISEYQHKIFDYIGGGMVEEIGYKRKYTKFNIFLKIDAFLRTIIGILFINAKHKLKERFVYKKSLNQSIERILSNK